MLSTDIAKHYDEIAKIAKPQQILTEELDLITPLFKQGAKILDIGCGTGRHLLPLADEGYMLTGIDLLAEHLELLKSKLKKKRLVKLIQGDFLKVDLHGEKFDGILVFWNSLNEICLTSASLRSFLHKATSHLNNRGYLIINIDDVELLALSALNFTSRNELKNGNSFEYHFQQIAFDPKKNISNTKETVKIYSKGELIERSEGILTQRWWSLSEIAKNIKERGLKMEVRHIHSNSELYLVISK